MQSQTNEYSKIIKRHKDETHSLRKQHLKEQSELLRKIMEVVHKQQKEQLKMKCDGLIRLID